MLPQADRPAFCITPKRVASQSRERPRDKTAGDEVTHAGQTPREEPRGGTGYLDFRRELARALRGRARKYRRARSAVPSRQFLARRAGSELEPADPQRPRRDPARTETARRPRRAGEFPDRP